MREPENSERVIAAVRIADVEVVYAGSTPGECQDCGAAVWLSPASRAMVNDGAGVVCVPCVVLRARAAGESTVQGRLTEAHRAEVLDWLRSKQKDPVQPS
jgi:hypothetical protein